ncbi:hypothetical protein [Bifidobacterium callimiconis]|uniref:Uncharacterized protein n=1 Tax=Bifidobacterium callimiconis TaxID=2306973 RepID=A0A430FIA1_9BIFI|nr:hypothetical protein [Bifidobacterium callimiconis]RSX52613.1 hypothetical protein D2E23_0341 [Bifidobacterium callimiconis]
MTNANANPTAATNTTANGPRTSDEIRKELAEEEKNTTQATLLFVVFLVGAFLAVLLFTQLTHIIFKSLWVFAIGALGLAVYQIVTLPKEQQKHERKLTELRAELREAEVAGR